MWAPRGVRCVVPCFISLLACLAPATINPTVVAQELQVTVATVTVVPPDRHHYSSSELPQISVAEAAGELQVQRREVLPRWGVCLCYHPMQGSTVCTVNADNLLRGTD